MKGYIEFISENRIGFITNPFGRILYINSNWPDGQYEKIVGSSKTLSKTVKKECKRGRSFNLEELTLELL